MISYGKLKANEEFTKGTKPNFSHFYLRPSYQFINQYILRLGVLDGKGNYYYFNAFKCLYIRFQDKKESRLTKLSRILIYFLFYAFLKKRLEISALPHFSKVRELVSE
jgi:hypothetical protein